MAIQTLEKLQKKILQQSHRKVMGLYANQDRELLNYEKDFKKLSRRKFTSATYQNLVDQIITSRIIYLSDFHSFQINIKNLTKIIQILIQSNTKPIVCLEMVHKNYQEHLDAFLSQKINEETFLNNINYSENWPFPWHYYQDLFSLAIQLKIPLLGINNDGDLKGRDKLAGDEIQSLLSKYPSSPIIVFYGEFHLTPHKIPRFNKGNDLIIYQNLDSVFEKSPHDKIIKFNDREFSLQSSPPWLKYEGLIVWTEYLYENSSMKHFPIIKGIVPDDPHGTFLHFAKEIAKFWQMELKNTHFTLINCENVKLIKTEIEKLPKGLENTYSQLLGQGQTFCHNDICYSPQFSINNLTNLAGQFLYEQVSSPPKSTHQKFYYFLKLHIFSYLSSKIINPRIKCNLYLNLYDLMFTSNKKCRIQFVLHLIDHPESSSALITKRDLSFYWEVAKYCGQFFAHYIFEYGPKHGVLLNTLHDEIFNQNDEQIISFLKNKYLPVNYNLDRKNYF